MNTEYERDWIGIATATFAALGAFWLYLQTMSPTVPTVFDDSLEFALVAQRWAIPHQTGYPLYAILIGLSAHLLPLGEVAWRVHLISALAGAGAVGAVVLIARRLGLSLVSALWAGIVLTTAGTFWAQARIAEVYTLHLLLVALLVLALLRWSEQADDERGLPVLPALIFGLGLAHHRTIVLWTPAVLVFVAWVDRKALRPQRAWWRIAAALLGPLLLYAYLPLRAGVGSLNGHYENTVSGFLNWIFATQYNVFLTENPFDQVRDAAFYRELALHQFSWIMLALLVIGVVWLARKRSKGWTLLVLGGLVNAGFAAAYQVYDVDVFWLPVVLVGAICAGAGLEALLRLLPRSFPGEHNPTRAVTAAILALLLVIVHVPRWRNIYAQVDLSDAWAAADFAEQTLNQQLPDDATIIGILGEMTLLRYWQATHDVASDVRTVAADTPAARLAEVERTLDAGSTPLLTRPLAGAEQWQLDALGPLIAVDAEREPAASADAAFAALTDTLRIVADVAPLQTHGPARQRVTLMWTVDEPPAIALKTSARVRNESGEMLAQLDCVPVHDAYPSTAWRAGETIVDSVELPALAAGTELEIVIYRADDGTPLGSVRLPAVQPTNSWEDAGVGTCAPAYRLK